MSAVKEENGSWTSQFWYKDIYGKRKHKCKRGFGTRADAEAFELNYINRARGSMDMRFADFVDVYAEDVRPTIASTLGPPESTSSTTRSSRSSDQSA